MKLFGVLPFPWTVLFNIQSSGKVKKAWGNVYMTDQCLVSNAAFFFIGIPNYKWHFEPTFIDRGLTTSEGHSVIRGEHNHGFFKKVGFFQDFNEPGKSLINS